MKIEYVAATSLRPEQRVEIEVLEGEWKGIYASRIESVAGRDISLEAPIREGVYIPLRPDTPLVVRALSADGVLSFDTVVLERRAGAHPTLIVERPTRIMAVQRRTLYRISARVPVLFSQVDTSRITDPANALQEAGILIDLSGGGAALRTSQSLKSGDCIRLRLPLGDSENELLVSAEVVAADTRRARFDTERVARLRFVGLSSRDEDRIFRFIRSLERGRLRARSSIYDV